MCYLKYMMYMCLFDMSKECYTCDNIKCGIVRTLTSLFDFASYLCFLWPSWTGEKETYDMQNTG